MLDENWVAKIADFGETQNSRAEPGASGASSMGKSLASFLGPLSAGDDRRGSAAAASAGDSRGSYGRFGNRRSSGMGMNDLMSGTVPWTAPEVVANVSAPTYASDVYSVSGWVLFEAHYSDS